MDCQYGGDGNERGCDVERDASAETTSIWIYTVKFSTVGRRHTSNECRLDAGIIYPQVLCKLVHGTYMISSMSTRRG